MVDATDRYQLEDIARQHAIAAGMFVPFAVTRLRGSSSANDTILAVVLRGIEGPGEAHRLLHLSWAPESAISQPFGVQAHIVTEWAALGVACALMTVYTGWRVRAVAGQGDSFDYWVSDGEFDLGLEVSGTIAEDVEARHRKKVNQLRDNPYGLGGYVVAVSFATRSAILSFHEITEASR